MLGEHGAVWVTRTKQFLKQEIPLPAGDLIRSQMANQCGAVNLLDGQRPQTRELPLALLGAGNRQHFPIVTRHPPGVTLLLGNELLANALRMTRARIRMLVDGAFRFAHQARVRDI